MESRQFCNQIRIRWNLRAIEIPDNGGMEAPRYLSLMKAAERRLLDIHELAELFQMPVAWLEAQAEQGFIPSLKVNREFMFNAVAVRDALLARAAESAEAEQVAATA